MDAATGMSMIDSGSNMANWGFSMIDSYRAEHKNYERNKDLMDIQFRNQQELNRQGQALQLDTWNKTSYPAQVAMLKEAGLNPGLVYAKGGTPGTTGSQGGGNAASASSQMRREPRWVDLSQSMLLKGQLEILEAQKANINADTANKQANTEGQGIRNEIARETKEEAKAIIRADNAITQSEKMITEIDAMIKYHIEGGQGGINPGKGEGYEIKTDALKQGASYKTILAEKGIKEAEERIQSAEADITEKLRSLGANNTTVNAIVQLIIAAMRKI